MSQPLRPINIIELKSMIDQVYEMVNMPKSSSQTTPEQEVLKDKLFNLTEFSTANMLIDFII